MGDMDHYDIGNLGYEVREIRNLVHDCINKLGVKVLVKPFIYK